MRLRRRKQNSGRKLKIILACLVVLLSVVYLATAERPTPEAALISIKSGAPNSSELLATIPSSNPLFGWGAVLLARELEKKGIDPSQSLQLAAKSIPDGPARIELNLILRRLAAERGERQSFDSDLLPTLKYRYRRADLEPEFIFTAGLNLFLEKKSEDALKLFEELRSKFPKTPFSGKARELSKRIRASKMLSLEESVAEIKLLISEGELGEARSLLKAAQAASEGSFELMFVEEALLRKENQGEKADELLLTISAEGPSELAAKAQFQSAKNAWNENNHLQALEMLDNLESRFPKATSLAESRYIEGRILEELSRFREAEKVYELASTVSGTDQAKPLKRSMWLKFIRSDYDGAIKTAEQIIALLQGKTEKQDQFSDLSSAIFWKARALSELGKKDEASKLFSSLLARERRGYYGFLSRAHLKGEPPKLLPSSTSNKPECIADGDFQSLTKRVAPLSSPALRELAQREIDFAFGNLRDGAKNETLVISLATQAEFSSRAGLNSSQIELAEEALKIMRLNGVATECEDSIASLSFPMPYLEHYRANAELQKLPPQILLAISRTESYFKPDVESTAGALGLMQLMPATAKREGWNGSDPLTLPSVNIPLGAKHLKRLLGEYNGSLIKVAAAYNAGSAAVNRWTGRYGSLPDELFVEFIGYPETNKYARRVLVSSAVYEELLRAGK